MKLKDMTLEAIVSDLEITKREAEAYKMLAEGYSQLAKIPDGDNNRRTMAAFRARGYEVQLKDCRDFAERLERIAQTKRIQNDTALMNWLAATEMDLTEAIEAYRHPTVAATTIEIVKAFELYQKERGA